MKSLLLALLLTGAAGGQFDQPVRGRQYVTFVAESQSIRADKPVELELRFHVADGFHINSHAPSSELQTPTGLQLDAAYGVKLSDVQYPGGKPYKVGDDTLNVYTDDFTLRVPVTASAGDHAIDGELTYQACDRAACYPPRTLKLKVLFSAK